MDRDIRLSLIYRFPLLSFLEKWYDFFERELYIILNIIIKHTELLKNRPISRLAKYYLVYSPQLPNLSYT